MNFKQRVEAKLSDLRSKGYTQISVDWRNSCEIDVNALNQPLLVWRSLYMGNDYDYEFWCNDSMRELNELIPRSEATRQQYDEEGNYLRRNYVL